MHSRKKTLKVLAIFIGGVVLVSILLGLLIRILAPEIAIEQLTLSQFTWTILLQHLGFTILLIVTLIYYVGKKSWCGYLRERRQRKGRGYFWKYVIGIRLFYIVVMIVVSALIEGLGRQLPGFNGEQGLISMFEGFGLDDRRDYGLMLALVAVITPLVEEGVYRTFLTDMFNRHGEIFGVIAGAVIFALSHMEADVFVNLFILGLILGYIYTKTKSGWYPFFFHLIINSMSLLFIFLA